MESIGVFCGSSEGSKPEYREAARQIGALIAKKNIATIYGAGNIGMMGHVADSVIENDGKIVGIIPKYLTDREICHEGLSQLYIVDSMMERKDMIMDMSDAFVALPGGLGTLDELFEVLTHLQLGISEKPCGILNTCGYFDLLIAQLDKAVDERFMRKDHRDCIVIDDNPERLIDRLINYQPPQISETWVKELKEKNSF